jgi:hypothetical protein
MDIHLASTAGPLGNSTAKSRIRQKGSTGNTITMTVYQGATHCCLAQQTHPQAGCLPVGPVGLSRVATVKISLILLTQMTASH